MCRGKKIVKIIFNYVNIFLYESMKIRYFFAIIIMKALDCFPKEKRAKCPLVSSLKIDSSVWTEQRAEKLKFRYIHTRQLYFKVLQLTVFFSYRTFYCFSILTYIFGRIFASEELIAIFPFGWMKSKPN